MVSLFSRLRTANGQSNPLPFYADLRSMGSVVPAPWGGHLVNSFELCNQVLRDRAWQVPDSAWRLRQGEKTRWNSISSREMGRTLPALNPPHHTRVRQSIGNLFDRSSLEATKDSVERTTERLFDRLAEELRENGEADFSSLISEELPSLTICEWLGLPIEDYALMRDLTHHQVFAQELLPSPSQLALSDTATLRLQEYFIELVAKRRAEPGDDPISTWLRTWDGIESDPAKADEAVYLLALLVVLAAPETTSTLISTMVWLLLEHPLQLEWLRAHPQHLPDAVEEVLRYDSPNHIISRVAGEDTTLGGVPVSKDQMVHLMIGAANHDPAQHSEPDVFNIRRRATHLSFSGGIHYCLGAPLARLEATTVLSTLLRRMPSLRVSSPPVWAPRVGFRRIASLGVVAG
ncbi:cytochrome P450 [Streptomyces sp. NPDC006638]|uniref:cytochrome P450 n=2 Tax=unclassified Streptomyces TaxID=2593676 RepID=UPI0033A036E3